MSGGKLSSGYGPGSSIFRGTPLEIDQLSRLMRGTHSPCTGRSRKLIFTGFPGPYRATVEIPEGCYTSRELDEIKSTILRLNVFAKVPMKKFIWIRPNTNSAPGEERPIPDSGAHYDFQNHLVGLTHQPTTGSHVPRIQGTKSELVHEMDHGIYRKGFFRDRDWEKVYYRGLADRNYEIIDDSNYLKDAEDLLGHPFSSADEAFASAVHAYFLHADQFAAYIQNEKTPPRMKVFGKLVWTYLRDRVFRGLVFTKDNADSFAGERFGPLLERLPGKKKSLLALFRDDDPLVRSMVAFNLYFYQSGDAKNEIPALSLAVQDSEEEVRSWALWALMRYGPAAKTAVPAIVKCLGHRDPFTRRLAALTLGIIGPEARGAVAALQKARRDADPEVSKAARSALKEISAARKSGE